MLSSDNDTILFAKKSSNPLYLLGTQLLIVTIAIYLNYDNLIASFLSEVH